MNASRILIQSLRHPNNWENWENIIRILLKRRCDRRTLKMNVSYYQIILPKIDVVVRSQRSYCDDVAIT